MSARNPVYVARAIDMIKLIKCELIKNKVLSHIISACTFPIIAILLSERGAELMREYSDIPYTSLLISLSNTVFLLFLLPILTALYSLSDSLTENTDNGWRLILMNVFRVERNIKVKFSVNIFIAFCSYVIYGLTLCFMLKGSLEGGLQGIFSFGNVLFLSLICLLPWLILIQTLFFMLPHVIIKVFTCLVMILMNILVTQTDWWRFYPPSYYIMITQSVDQNMNWIMCLISLALFVIFFFGCSKLMNSYLRKYSI